MGARYKLFDQPAGYFITLTIVEWIDIFIRKKQKLMIIASFRYCQKEKGLVIYVWCLMPSHLHLVCCVTSEIGMSVLLRDFKYFTSKQVVKLVKGSPESQRDRIL